MVSSAIVSNNVSRSSCAFNLPATRNKAPVRAASCLLRFSFTASSFLRSCSNWLRWRVITTKRTDVAKVKLNGPIRISLSVTALVVNGKINNPKRLRIIKTKSSVRLRYKLPNHNGRIIKSSRPPKTPLGSTQPLMKTPKEVTSTANLAAS